MKDNTPLDEDIISLIEEQGAKRFERCFRVCGAVLIFFECLMLLNQLIIVKTSPFKFEYICCYVLLLVTCLCIFIDFYFAKKYSAERHTKTVRRAEVIFMFVIEIWAMGITLIDTLAHGFVDVLVYISVLALLPSIVFVRPAIGVTTQVIFDLLIYIGVLILNPERFTYILINFTTYAAISIIIYCLSYKIQKDLYVREAQLTKTAENDALTGLQNRFSYSNYIQMLKSHPENRQFAFLLLDLNGLKTTNDTMGHAYGDDLIKGAAWCIQKAFHKNGVCFRTGGDEFVVILNKRLTEIDSMLRIFETLCQNWKGELVSSPSVSYGLAEALKENYADVDQLIELADKRMYEMKQVYYTQEGKDRRK